MTRLQRIEQKIFTPEQLSRTCAAWRVKGLTTVFTNGVFDILHRGHIALLSAAADCGDRLIVGLNSDPSVRTLGKGSERPLNAQADRALVLSALQMIDAVVLFDSSTPLELIERLEPDVLVKGGDYDQEEKNPNNPRYIVGSDLQIAAGRDVVTIPIVEGYSSTAIIEKSRRGEG